MMLAKFFFVASSFAGIAHAAQPVIHEATDPAGGCFEFEKGAAQLKGTIFTRIYFGPPNYGENPATDRREEQALLLLDAPICVQAIRDATAQSEVNVIVVQLAAISVQPSVVYGAVGHRVEVSGSLFHSETGHHRTPVLVDVTAVKILD